MKETRQMTIEEVYESLKRNGYYNQSRDTYSLTINGQTSYYDDFETMSRDLEYYQGIKIDGVVTFDSETEHLLNKAYDNLECIGVDDEQWNLKLISEKLERLSNDLDCTRMNKDLRKEYQNDILEMQRMLEEIDEKMNEHVYHYRNFAIGYLDDIYRKQ